MSGPVTFQVNTGNPDLDQQTLAQYQQSYAAQGMQMAAQPLPGGGFYVSVTPTGAPAPGYSQSYPQGYGQPAQPAQAYGQQPAGAMAGAGAMAMHGGGFAPAGAPGQQQGGMVNQLAQAVGAPTLDVQRLQYLRKVYGLLTASAFVAVIVGYAVVSLGPTTAMRSPEGTVVQVPALVGAMLANPTLQYIAFGALVVGTIVASWFSKVKYLNIAALLGVSALMGVEIAPMVFEAQFYAGMGATMSAAPVRDAFLMVLAVFCSMTAYVFVSRKSFSWLGSIVAIGFVVVLVGCVMTFFLDSEAFSLAIATAGALLSTLTLLYVTWYIFRKSEMDDAVGDALALLVQLRNLFMFLLRMFMSNR